MVVKPVEKRQNKMGKRIGVCPSGLTVMPDQLDAAQGQQPPAALQAGASDLAGGFLKSVA